MEFHINRDDLKPVPLGGNHKGGKTRYLFTCQGPESQRFREGAARAESLDIHFQEYEPGGSTSEGSHENVEQAYYILEGQMRVKVAGKEYLATPGSCVLIPRNAKHSFENATDGRLRLLFIQSTLP